jgi:histidyl-tRNA synthetase
MIKAARGTRDILPPDTALWQHVEQASRDIFHRYNFHEIRTPVLEDLQLFQRSIGDETDIVSKELFTLREGTSSEGALRNAWQGQYGSRYEAAKVVANTKVGDSEVDFVVYQEGRVSLVEVKNRANTATVSQLRRLREIFQGLSAIPVTIALAAPSDEIDRLAGLGIGDVEFQRLVVHIPDDQWLALRPENTAGVVRAYIEHKLGETGRLHKLYYIGPQFRRERPQKGRYRQFYQIGAEVLGPPSAGSESPARDAEIISMLAHLLREVGIKEWSLQLNSVGCVEDRARYSQALRQGLANLKDKMCDDCRRRAETNPLRVLDCKVEADQPIIESLPKISEYLDEPCRAHFNEVKKILNHVGIRYQVNERMVRGLDYYTRTTFEFTHGGLGAQSALLGGGRYDGLSEALGGPKAPGIGFALGLDRFVLALQAEQTVGVPNLNPVVYVAPLGEGMNAEAAVIARELRKSMLAVDLGDESFRVKKSFEAAERAGAKYIIFVGANEISSGQFALKNLATGEQTSVARDGIASFLKTRE